MNCQFCGKALSDPISMARCAGPSCYGKGFSRELNLRSFNSESSFVDYANSHKPDLNVGGFRPKKLITLKNKIFLVKTELGFANDKNVIPVSQTESEVEFVSNKIADILDISVPLYGFLNIGKQKVFATQLFTAKINKEHKDIEVVGEMRPLRTFVGSNMDLENILNVVKKQSSAKEEDVAKIIQLVVFDALIGNTDRHSENIAFIKINDQSVLERV